jgi:hypothetical protein
VKSCLSQQARVIGICRARRFAVLLIGVACLAAGPLLADASRGELAGHRLGERVALDVVPASKAQADGSLRIAAAGADDRFDSVYLYASPVSGEVGKIALSRRLATLEDAKSVAGTIVANVEARYPDWERLRAPLPMGKTGGEMLSRLQLGKHALIVFYRPLEQAGYEVMLELEYSSKAPQRKAWRQLVGAEREVLREN